MLRRDALRTLAAGSLSAALTGRAAAAADRRPNIIVALTDDQRWDTVGYEGDPLARTPQIDALAAEGTAFRNSFVTTPICAASRASIFASLHYASHGFNFGMPNLDRDLRALFYPQILKQAGYRTALYGKFGVWFEERLIDNVIQALRARGLAPGHDHGTLFDEYRAIDRRPYVTPDEDGTPRHSLDKIERHALRFLDTQPADQPFCLSLSFNSPHETRDRFPPAPQEETLLDLVEIPAPDLDDPAIYEALPRPLKSAYLRERYLANWPTAEKRLNVQGYYEMIAGIDRVLGNVRARLAETGQAGNTVILFTSDNGLVMGDRGLGGKWTHFDEAIRVPMAIFDPRNPVPGGHRPEAMALNIDIAPTILDLAGLPQPAAYQGRSLVPLMQPGPAPADWRTSFYCEHEHGMDFDIPNWMGLRETRYKFAEYHDAEGAHPMLHDLQADPDELVNLAEDPAHAARLAAMRAEARARYEGYRAFAG